MEKRYFMCALVQYHSIFRSSDIVSGFINLHDSLGTENVIAVIKEKVAKEAKHRIDKIIILNVTHFSG